MKKLFLLVLSLSLLIGCQLKKEPEVKEDINKETVDKIVGRWEAHSYDFGTYEITNEREDLTLNQEELIIEYADEETVRTTVKGDETFHYTFEIVEEGIVIYPQYDVEQISNKPGEKLVGGDLAPIELKKEITLSENYLFGEWDSVEDDYKISLRISPSYQPGEIKLETAEIREFLNSEEVVLTMEKESGKSISYLNQDKSLRYSFGLDEKKQLLHTRAVTDPNQVDMSRPMHLKRR